MMFNAKDMGIDLGTANTLVYMREKGIIVNEPSVVAINTDTREVLAVGNEAKDMIGRTPGNIVAIRPMKDGVIADFDVTQAMLRYFINKAYVRSLFGPKPRIVICVPSGVTEVEKRAVLEAAIAAGSKEKDTYLIEEPMAAAIGAGLPVAEPTGSMVVDIGGGTSEVAIISLGGIVTSTSLRVAGDALDSAIVNYIRKEFSLAVGDRTAEEIKITIGSAYPLDREEKMEIRGRDLVSGLPMTIEINSIHIREALAEPVGSIINILFRCSCPSFQRFTNRDDQVTSYRSAIFSPSLSEISTVRYTICPVFTASARLPVSNSFVCASMLLQVIQRCFP